MLGRVFHRFSVSSRFSVLPLWISSARHKSRACFKGRPTARKDATKLSSRKLMIANDIRHIFTDNSMVAVFHYNDLTVSEWDGLRTKLEKKSVRIKVIPCKVTARALESTKYKNMGLLLRGSSAIAYSKEPQLSDLLSITKPEPKLLLLGGVVEDTLMTPEGFKSHSNLPNKMVLYQQLLGTLMLPQTLLSTMLLTNQTRLTQMFEQLAQHGQNTKQTHTL